jgi:hypothetical protein
MATKPRMTPAETVEEVRWFLESGIHPENIATALGRSLGGLERVLRNQREHEMAATFDRALRVTRKGTSGALVQS